MTTIQYGHSQINKVLKNYSKRNLGFRIDAHFMILDLDLSDIIIWKSSLFLWKSANKHELSEILKPIKVIWFYWHNATRSLTGCVGKWSRREVIRLDGDCSWQWHRDITAIVATYHLHPRHVGCCLISVVTLIYYECTMISTIIKGWDSFLTL